jgi:hypothetical protein
MGKLEDIEKAVGELSPDEFAKFRAWFDELEAHRFDTNIESDAKAGKLDALAEQALKDHRHGRTREL